MPSPRSPRAPSRRTSSAAISRTHPNDIKARALLFHLTTESTLRRTVSNAASEQFNRSNRVDSPSSPLTDFSQQPTSLSLADLRVGDTQKGDETLLSAKQLLSGQPEREAFLRSWEGDADPDETGNPNPNNNNASGNALLAVPSGSLQNNNNTSSHSVLVPEHSSPARSEEAQRLSQAAVLVSTPEVEMLRLYFSNIMQDALHSLDDYLRHTEEGERGDYNCTGCTACVVGITSNFILCANVGDSGAAVYTPQQIDPISLKHRLSDPREQQRITGAGYAVVNDRIEGLLAVPRALGDFDFKQCGGKSVEEQAVTCTPDVTVRPVPVDSRWGVILACDGVWDTATVHQIHYALTHTQSDLDVAGSATEAVLAGQRVVPPPSPRAPRLPPQRR
ncbi:Protein phosphatase 2C, putative [Angomonas deanei]|uniref:protein-serine/threonine phosphatase n=1 Tax=Angomonas deanei TaxID=59799 RepID=A0A7G2C540_9TRYP|nr:Protein phosphatase 2C, putative [Angomonas deanei]